MKLAVPAVALSLVTILAPVVAGEHGQWVGHSGAAEPNTRWDDEPGKVTMFTWANNDSVERVYLNGVILHSYAAPKVPSLAFYTPNAAGGSVAGTAANYAYAMLGFWRDCNRDGYIGARAAPGGPGAFAQYPRAGQDIDETVCRPGTPYNPTNPLTNSPDGMIDEFRWIGPSAGCDAWEVGCPGNPVQPNKICIPPSNPNSPLCPENPNGRPDSNGMNDVTDNRSRVWGDWGHPGAAHANRQGLSPFPRGTLGDSDGTLQYVDDAMQGEISAAVGPGWYTKPVIGRCEEPHPTFLGGPSSRLPIADRGTCGLWPLHQANRLWNDSTCLEEDPARGRPAGCSQPDSLVTVWDTEGADNPCDDGANLVVPLSTVQPSLGNLYVRMPALAPRADPNRILVDGSLAGTLKHVAVATNGTSNDPDGTCGDTGPLDDDSCNSLVHQECDSQASDKIHIVPDFLFNWTNATSSHKLANFGFFGIEPDGMTAVGSGVIVPDVLVDQEASLQGPGWYSNTVWSHRPPRTGWGYTTTMVASFYADVTPQAFARAGLGATASSALPARADDRWTYGTEACPSITTGGSNVNPANKWECSVTEWAAARLARTKLAHDPVLGDKYDLRDVDCYDNSLAEGTVRVSEDPDVAIALSDVKAGAATCADVHD